MLRSGKIYGTIAGCIAIVISPFVMYAGGITTFLNSMSQFVSLPVLCTILGIFMFKRIPKYMPKVITVFHVVCYGAFLLINRAIPALPTRSTICTQWLFCSRSSCSSCGI